MEGKNDYESNTDEELAARLHQLFIVDEVPEVEIIHPIEGKKILTREAYLGLAKHLDRARNMTQEERAKESRKIARRMRKRFKKVLVRAEKGKVFIVDIEDESTFGFDINGKKIPVEGTLFVSVQDYPGGVKKLDNELGCFVAEDLRGPLSRILAKAPPTIPDEAVETDDKRVTH